MWAWQKLKKPHAANTLMALKNRNWLRTNLQRRNLPWAVIHTSMKRLDGQFNGYPSACLDNLKCVYQCLHPHFGLHNSIFCRGGCQNSYDTPPAIQWKQEYYGPKAVEDLHLWQIQNFHPSHGPVEATICGKLIKISTLLREIDPTFIYCHYNPDKNLTICYTSSDKDIPSRISELQIFHPTLKPNPMQNDVWAQAWISFNQDRATFLQDMGSSLMGIKSVFLKTLYRFQKLHADAISPQFECYQTLASPQKHHVQHLCHRKMPQVHCLHTKWMANTLRWQVQKIHPVIGLSTKRPATSFLRRDMRRMAPSFWRSLWKPRSMLNIAIWHQLDPQEQPICLQHHLPQGTGKYQLPQQDPGQPPVLHPRNHGQHQQVQWNPQVHGLPAAHENDVSFQLGHTSPSCSWHQRMGRWWHHSHFPKELWRCFQGCPYTPAMLNHTYGEEAFCWMSADGIKDAKETAWDDTTNCLISIEKQLANAAMNEECPAWATLEIEHVALIDQDKQWQGPDVTQWPEHANINLENNSNSTFGIGNRTIASPQANDEITLDSTLQTKTATTPHQGTQVGPNSSPSVVNALSTLSPEDLHHLLHLTQQMNLPAETDNTAGASALVADG